MAELAWQRLSGTRIDPLIGMDLKDRFGASREEIDADPAIPPAYKDLAGIPGFERATALIGKISREHEIPVLMAAQALPSQLPVLERQCALNGLHFLDLNEAFTRFIAEHQITDDQQFRLDNRDTHPNAKAHRIIAEVLENWLNEHI